ALDVRVGVGSTDKGRVQSQREREILLRTLHGQRRETDQREKCQCVDEGPAAQRLLFIDSACRPHSNTALEGLSPGAIRTLPSAEAAGEIVPSSCPPRSDLRTAGRATAHLRLRLLCTDECARDLPLDVRSD